MNGIGKAQAITLNGLEAKPVVVEAQMLTGLPAFHLVGLPDTSLKEAKSRVEAAIAASGVPWKAGRLTVNLSPAELPKTGSSFDLAIALSVLSLWIPGLKRPLEKTVLVGELGLDGQVRSVRGILPTVIGAVQNGFNTVVVPDSCKNEASLIPGIEVVAVETLSELFRRWRIHLPKSGRGSGAATVPEADPDGLGGSDPSNALPRHPPVKGLIEGLGPVTGGTADSGSGIDSKAGLREAALTDQQVSLRADLLPDMSQVRGQSQARQALEVAAAGGHHLLLSGEPGVGKTMLARCLPGILPDLTPEQALSVTAIHSLAGTLPEGSGLLTQPQFVAPHHTISRAALVGGGSLVARPGAISLAHYGVLFLDEAPEFNPSTLDCLRQPLESGQVEVVRLRAQTRYPARFQLILAANPCPCSQAQQLTGTGQGSGCRCTPYQKLRYQNRISGPLLDRIDLQCFLYRPGRGELRGGAPAEASVQVKQRVIAARTNQMKRWQQYPGQLNATVSSAALKHELPLQLGAQLDQWVESGQLSMRGADRLLRIAYTLADLQTKPRPELADLLEAMTLRRASR